MPTNFPTTSRRTGTNCPICGDISGRCRLPADGKSILCLTVHEDIHHPEWKYVKENEGAQAAGVWGVFVPRDPCLVCNDLYCDSQILDGGKMILCASLTEQIEHSAYRYVKQSRNDKGIFVLREGKEIPNKEISEQRIRDRLQWQHERQQRLEEEAKQYRSGLSRRERDANIRRLAAALGLKGEHREQLRRRGLTDEQIDRGLFFSISPNYPLPNTISEKLPGVKLVGDRRVLAASKSGIACVAFDFEGLAIGFQLRDENPNADNKYLWAKSTFSSHLQTGEMPITTHGNPESWVLLCEGILKPYVAHSRLNVPVVGASNGGFVGSPLQFRAAIGTVRTLAIALDGGDIINLHVLGRWETFLESYSYPYAVWFCWWGQFQKSDPDIDEVDPTTWKPQWLSPEEMGNLLYHNALVNCWIALGRMDFAWRLMRHER